MSSSTPRDELLERREQLKARIEKQAELRPIAQLLEALDGQGVDYELIRSKASLDHPATALLARLPNLGSNIHWTRMEEVEQLHEDEPGNVLRQMFAREGKGRRLLLTWDNGALPALLLPAEAIAAHAAVVLEPSLRTWIFDPEADWFIEADHSGDVRRGRIPTD